MTPAEWGDGSRSFAAELTRFAETARCPHFAPLVAQIRRPLLVAIVGRHGVGRSTVEAALRARGVPVAAEPVADVRVVVIAEALKPEDEALLASDPRPTLVVLSKSDVIGASAGGPLAAAKVYAARITSGDRSVPYAGRSSGGKCSW